MHHMNDWFNGYRPHRRRSIGSVAFHMVGDTGRAASLTKSPLKPHGRDEIEEEIAT